MIRKLFICIAAVGLMINLYADLIVLRQNKESIRTGEWVNRSYSVTVAIDATRIAILEHLSKHQPLEHVQKKIEILNQAVKDSAELKTRVALVEGMIHEGSPHDQSVKALEILAEMGEIEASVLNERMKNDSTAERASVNQALFCNSVDVLLIFLFVGFFVYERRRAGKLQSALARSLIDVEATSQKLQLALNRRETQLKMTVHDLKNPLGSIKSFAELIYDEAANKDSVLEMANIVRKISHNTLSLVGAMLQADEMAQDEMPKVCVNVMECLKETCSFLDPIAEEKNQKIQITDAAGALFLLGSKHQIQDLFFNIVGNALKFSPRGTLVTVERLNADGYQDIRICDHGPGFAPEDFPKLFLPGTTLTAKPTGGEASHGLGLYSAKHAVNSLGGSIVVSNGQGGGACVTLRFPELETSPDIPPTKNPQTHLGSAAGRA
jgi:signal transduction histidine kinase